MDFLAKAKENYDYSVSVRRYLHENPEPSSYEPAIAALFQVTNRPVPPHRDSM